MILSKYLFILKKIIYFWNSSNKFKSFINILSFSVTTFCISIIIITLSINQGFKTNAVDIISKIDGHSRYYKKNQTIINDDDYFNIKNILQKKSKSVELTRLSTKECILKSSAHSEGVIIKVIDDNGYNVFNLNNFLIEGIIEENAIIIGRRLSNKLDLNINEYVALVSLPDKSTDEFELIKIKISGLYSTNIPSFDDYTIYGHINTFEQFLNIGQNGYSTVVAKDINYQQYNSDHLNINTDDYYSINFKERHNNFLNWLNSYDIPINILLFFVFIISVINTVSMTYLDILTRKNDLTRLYLIGYNSIILRRLFLFKNIIISILSSLFGVAISILFIAIQKKFSFIKIPSDIYFNSHLPLDYNYNMFLFIMCFIFIVSTYLSRFAIKSVLRNNLLYQVHK